MSSATSSSSTTGDRPPCTSRRVASTSDTASHRSAKRVSSAPSAPGRRWAGRSAIPTGRRRRGRALWRMPRRSDWRERGRVVGHRALQQRVEALEVGGPVDEGDHGGGLLLVHARRDVDQHQVVGGRRLGGHGGQRGEAAERHAHDGPGRRGQRVDHRGHVRRPWTGAGSRGRAARRNGRGRAGRWPPGAGRGPAPPCPRCGRSGPRRAPGRAPARPHPRRGRSPRTPTGR